MYTYRAYGLSCESDTAIPGLHVSSRKPEQIDLRISLSSTPPEWVQAAWHLPASLVYNRPAALENPAYTVTSLGRGAYFELTYFDGARLVTASAGDRLWVSYAPPLTIDDVAVYLRGPAMGFVLQRRGITALHASTVRINGRAIALCGTRASGKSTTAAALSLRGIPVLCEDITALNEQDGITQVEPGYPRICLWPEAVQDLLGTRDALPRLTPTWEKCFLELGGENTKFESERRPLGSVYILAPRVAGNDAPRIEEISARQALLELIQNTYMNWLLDRRQRAAEFEVLSKLVLQVPVRRIVPHLDPTRITALCELIEEDVERLLLGADSAAQVSNR